MDTIILGESKKLLNNKKRRRRKLHGMKLGTMKIIQKVRNIFKIFNKKRRRRKM